MDEKRGEQFDGAEADDFFGEDEENQQELSQPSRTMAERCAPCALRQQATQTKLLRH